MYKFIFTFLFASISWNVSAELTKYEFEDWAGASLPTYVSKPNKINAATRLVVVMHGRKRNAEEYRDQWVKASQELNLLVIVPEFSEKQFPEVWGFNYGNIKTKNLEPIEQDLHAFMAIEPLAKNALKKFKIKSKNWGIYGPVSYTHLTLPTKRIV